MRNALNSDDGSKSPGENGAPPSLPAVLNVFDAIALVVGSIIGSGVFLKADTVATQLGSFGPIVSIWIGVGIVTLCGSLALAELAAMMPQAGGPYIYLREAYGKLPAFLWGWTEFWVIRTGSLGALACATVIYLDKLVPFILPIDGLPVWAHGPTAIGLIMALTLLNWRNTRWGATLQSGTTVVKVGFLLMLVAVPWLTMTADTNNLSPMWPSKSDASAEEQAEVPASATPSDLADGLDGIGADVATTTGGSAAIGPPAWGLSFLRAMGVAMIAVLWAFDGWINIGPVAEEIQRPQRNVPLALVIGIGLIIVVYVLANTTYHLVLPMHRVAGNKTVAADVLSISFGTIGVPLASLGVMCSTFGATQSNMLTGPRIYFAMARDNLLPRRLADVHAVYATPGNAVLGQGIWASLLAAITYLVAKDPRAAFDALTTFVIFGGSVFYAMAVGAVFVMRRKRPELERPYRTWGYPWTPALYLAAFAAALVSLLVDSWKETASGSILILAGVVYYFWQTRRAGNIHGPPIAK